MSTLAPLRYPPFRYLAAGRVVTMLGNAVAPIALAFATGVAMEQFGIAWETSIQEHIPPDKLARVYSYDALGSFIAIPVGQVAVGPHAESLGVVPALVVLAAIAGLAVAGVLTSRDVRTLEHRPAARSAKPMRRR